MNYPKAIRILHVEDNPVEAQVLSAIAKNGNSPAELVHAGRLDQAIQCYASGDFDVVLLDLTLPDAQGRETIRRAQASMPKAPIIVLTGQDDERLSIDCAEMGIQDYLLKGEVTGSTLRRIIAFAIERKRAQQELQASQEELKKHREHLEKLARDRTSELAGLNAQLLQAQKLEAVGRLARGIAHDFSNLFSVLSGYASFLTDSLEPGDPRRTNAEKIQCTVERASMLARKLLTYSRNQSLPLTVLNLNATVASLAPRIRRLISESIELRVRLMPDEYCIRADVGQVEQILLNLIIKACDAMPNGGTLLLTTTSLELDAVYAASHPGVQPGHYVMLTATNSERGMNAQARSHRLGTIRAAKGRSAGTELGWATVREIVKQVGGHLDVLSESRGDMTFQVYFPRIREPAARAEEVRGAARSFAGTETILLAEDEPFIRALARRSLASYGYEVLEATDGMDALKVAQDHGGAIDLLITDVAMPVLGGLELVDRLSALRPAIKVLVLSGCAADTFPERGTDTPSVAFLAKPFSPPELVRKIRETLDFQADRHH